MKENLVWAGALLRHSKGGDRSCLRLAVLRHCYWWQEWRTVSIIALALCFYSVIYLFGKYFVRKNLRRVNYFDEGSDKQWCREESPSKCLGQKSIPAPWSWPCFEDFRPAGLCLDWSSLASLLIVVEQPKLYCSFRELIMETILVKVE